MNFALGELQGMRQKAIWAKGKQLEAMINLAAKTIHSWAELLQSAGFHDLLSVRLNMMMTCPMSEKTIATSPVATVI